jgi:hypothetical protein
MVGLGVLAHLADAEDLAAEPSEASLDDVADRQRAVPDAHLAPCDCDLRFVERLEPRRHRSDLRLDVLARAEHGIAHEHR